MTSRQADKQTSDRQAGTRQTGGLDRQAHRHTSKERQTQTSICITDRARHMKIKSASRQADRQTGRLATGRLADTQADKRRTTGRQAAGRNAHK